MLTESSFLRHDWAGTSRDAEKRGIPERMAPSKRHPPKLMVAITSLFVLFLLLPLVALLWRAIDRASFWRYLDDRMVIEALKLSFMTTLITLMIAFVIGTPAAYLLSRWKFRGYRIIE